MVTAVTPPVAKSPSFGQAKYSELAPGSIKVPPSHRAVAPEKVGTLAKSILEVGLLEPVGVTSDFTLIYGAHRLAACRELELLKIPVMVHELGSLHAELAEIDENLMRHGLTKAEEAKALARRKEIYEALHPETQPVTKRGGPGRGKKTNGKMPLVSFAADTAAKTGKSRSTIEREARIGKDLDDGAMKILTGTPVANNKSQLVKLAKLPKDAQRQVAQKLAQGEASTVEEATQQVREVQDTTEERGDAGKSQAAKKGLKGFAMVVSALEALGLYGQHKHPLQAIKTALEQYAKVACAVGGKAGKGNNGR